MNNKKKTHQTKNQTKPRKKNLILFSKSWKALGFSVKNLPTSGSWQKSGRILHMPHIMNTSKCTKESFNFLFFPKAVHAISMVKEGLNFYILLKKLPV